MHQCPAKSSANVTKNSKVFIRNTQTLATPCGRLPRVKHLNALTGIRFFAALFVAIYHFWPVAGLPDPVKVVVKSGFMGVSFFFMLSGFIMVYNYVPKAEGLNKAKYWWVRVARIYPIYFIAMLISLPGFLKSLEGGISAAFPHLLTRFTAVHAWIPSHIDGWNTPSWSLSCEAFFYLLFPFLLPWFAKLNSKSARVLFVVCALAALVGPVLSVILRLEPKSAAYYFLYYSPLFHTPQFFAGAALGRIYLEDSAPKPQTATLWLAGAILVGLMFVFYGQAIFVQCGVMLAPFAMLIWALAKGDGLLTKFLSSGPMQLLGDASYSLYILHAPVFAYLSLVVPALKKDPPMWMVGAIYLPVAVLVSILAFLFIEKPARKAIRTWAKA